MTVPDLPAEAVDLYQLTPSEFIAARNALVKRLRSAGAKQEAAEVAALRKPAATAWALNLLARAEPQALESVLDAGRSLRQATEQALRGDRSGFQAAQAAEREAIQRAVGLAADLAGAAGSHVPEPGRQRMADTLRAAIVQPAVADELRSGTIEKDASPAGLGFEAMSVEDIGSEHVAAAAEQDRRARRSQLEEELRAAQRTYEQAQAAASEAEEHAAALRKQAEAAGRTVEAMSSEVVPLSV